VRLLIDTHLLLWAYDHPKRLPRAASALFADESNDLLFSVASIWEVAIKKSRMGSGFTIRSATPSPGPAEQRLRRTSHLERTRASHPGAATSAQGPFRSPADRPGNGRRDNAADLRPPGRQIPRPHPQGLNAVSRRSGLHRSSRRVLNHPFPPACNHPPRRGNGGRILHDRRCGAFKSRPATDN